MSHLTAVVALDTAVVSGLGAFLRHVAFGIAVAAAHDAGLGTVTGVVALLTAIEARTSSATAAGAWLQGLRTLRLAVTEGCRVSNLPSMSIMVTYPTLPQLKQA
jgi:hypothetical protein